MDFLALAAECAQNVHPQTISAIVRTESAGNPWAIGINGPKPAASFHKPTTQPEAVQEAKRLIAHGYNIDMGLGQINSANLPWLGLSVEQVFDPCTNLRATATILTDNYARASKQHPQEQASLAAALSAYNTGNFAHGITNGYVQKIYLAAEQPLPVIRVPAPKRTAPQQAAHATIAGDGFGNAMQPTQKAPDARQLAQAAKLLELLREMQIHINETPPEDETIDPAIVFPPSENRSEEKTLVF